MEFTKDLEGEIILALPTGNNVRRQSTNEPIEMEVVKVKRKYVEMKRLDVNITKDYCQRTGATQQAINTGFGGNAGYRFFRNMKEYRVWQCRTTLIDNIEKMTRGYGLGRNLDKLDGADLATLERILLKVCDN